MTAQTTRYTLDEGRGRASSNARCRSSAAFCGSGASMIAETTATPAIRWRARIRLRHPSAGVLLVCAEPRLVGLVVDELLYTFLRP